ncbi:response regulator, partial [Tianweitania sp.]|uniref:response regulator n=1 Tax=Tianweitania sp. TaxID=2021634 RepID=UPI00289E04B1
MAGPVLIIDDDPVQRRLVDAALTKFGFSTLVADGGAAALSILDGPQGRDVAIIVLDMVMPGMDGLAVLGELSARGVEAPVIVQTAQGGVDNVVAAMRAGAFDFVVKPASPERLH